MFNLALKDIVIQKKIILVTAFICLILCVINKNNLNTIACIPVALSYTVFVYSCSNDDKNNSNILFCVLPIKRKDIVLGKYIFNFLFLLFGIAISFIFVLLVCTNYLYKTENIFILIFTSLISNSILFSVFIPVYFKLGYKKSSYFITISFFLLFFLPNLIYKYFKGSMGNVLSYLHHVPNNLIILWILIFIIVVNTISIMISINIFEKKDL